MVRVDASQIKDPGSNLTNSSLAIFAINKPYCILVRDRTFKKILIFSPHLRLGKWKTAIKGLVRLGLGLASFG